MTDTPEAAQRDVPDRDDGRVYVMPDDLDLAVRVALSTGRPLLLRGKPGSGKSSLAPYVARQRNWRYYAFVVTSQTRARDLLWTFDGIRRLADAQISKASHDPGFYVEPGPLWWALAPQSAARHVRVNASKRAGRHAAAGDFTHPLQKANAGRSPHHSVVLIDEIDKADPDVPNGLLEPLSSHGFTVADSGQRVEIEQPSAAGRGAQPFMRDLVVITTNEERELPQAFLRRCVIAELDPPDNAAALVAIVEQHLLVRLGAVSDGDRALALDLAKALGEARESARAEGIREPSTAEYLDAFWACRALNVGVADPDWDAIRRLTLIKPQRLRD